MRKVPDLVTVERLPPPYHEGEVPGADDEDEAVGFAEEEGLVQGCCDGTGDGHWFHPAKGQEDGFVLRGTISSVAVLRIF